MKNEIKEIENHWNDFKSLMEKEKEDLVNIIFELQDVKKENVLLKDQLIEIVMGIGSEG